MRAPALPRSGAARPAGGLRHPPCLRPLGLALGIAASLLGPATGTEALWQPPGFGTNDPNLAVAVGDSITLGVLGDGTCANPGCVADRPYPAALQGLLAARYPGFQVANAGQGGETTGGGLARLGTVLATYRPGFVLIMEGTNDATFRMDPSLTAGTLQAMVQLAKANSTIPILGTIVPNFRDDPDVQSRIGAVNAMLAGIAAVEDVLLVDTFAAMNDPSLFGPADILHPNQHGYDVLGASWVPAMSVALDASQPIRPQMAINAPAPGAVVLQPFVVSGWAIDPAASSGSGVDGLNVWAYPVSGGPGVFVGVPAYGISRPDVSAAFGARFNNSGYELTVSGLAPGTYELVVYAHSTASGTFDDLRSVTVTVDAALMVIDTPPPGAVVLQPFVVSGWAIDPAAPSGSGVDGVNVWAYPVSGGPGVFVGAASVVARPEVGAVLGARFTNSGYGVTVSGLAPGTYQLVVYAHSTASGAFNDLRSVTVSVDPPLMVIDTPPPGAVVLQPFVVSGWAIDPAAPSGSGVDGVNVWAYPVSGGPGVFVGAASVVARPEVGAVLGARFTNSGYGVTVSGLAPGTYQLVVYAHSTASGAFNDAQSVTVSVGTQ